MAKRIPVLSEEADYGLDRSLAGSLGLRGPAEYEGELLDRTVDWISERPDIDSQEILTYNGQGYDLPILKHRSYCVNDQHPGCDVVNRLYLLTQTSDHTDLILEMKEREGYWVSLDDALDMYGIDSDTPYWMDKPVEGSDMPSMGLELLSNTDNPRLRDVARRYAASDVEPLFELHEKLRGQTA